MLRNALLLIVFSILLVSCLGIEQVVTINNDNSGSISFTYRIAKEISDLGSYGNTKKPLPLPLLRSDFERVVGETNGLTLSGYSSTENEKDVIVHADVAFTSLAALNALALPDDAILKGQTNGNATTLSVEIPAIRDADITEDTLAMLKEMSAGYNLVFTVRAPKEIVSSSMGDVSKDKRSVTFATTVYDLARAKEKQLFTIKW